MIKFQFGSFESSIPGWFDWFSLMMSLFVSIISIYGGYKIATNIYSKEKSDRDNEGRKLDLAEYSLFKNSLEQLKSAIKNQEEDILKYIKSNDFSLTFHQNVNIGFLQFIDAKKIYLMTGLINEAAIQKINDLLKSLYVLSDFRTSLRDEVRTYILRYNQVEEEFYSYRELLYFKYYGLCNKRSQCFEVRDGVKMWKFEDEDTFMKEYSTLINKTMSDDEIIENNTLKSREKLISDFVLEISKISGKYMPEDIDAIHINNISNKVNAAFINLEEITSSHFRAMESYSANLKTIMHKIELFLEDDTVLLNE